MSEDKYAVIDKIMGQLTLEQKVGQLFTQPFNGTIITPDLRHQIENLNCAGLRITQFFRQFRMYARPGEERKAFDKSSPDTIDPPSLFDDRKDTLCKPPYLSIKQYAEVMNQVKDIASSRPYDIPLHCMLDQEGDGSFDFVRGGVRYFPNSFGLARTNDPDLVYKACLTVAKQLKAVGFNMINSPCVDISFNPEATYIGCRSFSHDVETVCEMASAALRGYTEGGLLACGKHFPGRGATSVDPHMDASIIDKDEKLLREEDLAPYKRMISEGLGAVMPGHSTYPCWDEKFTASTSKAIITGLLKGEMGFEGMVAPDSMVMGAVAKEFGVPKACEIAIKAGANCVLMKESGPIRDASYKGVLDAVKSGEITEDHVDNLIQQTLKVKVDYGMFDAAYRPDPEKAEGIIHDPEMKKIEVQAAEAAVHIARDEDNLLPLAKNTKALLIECIAGQHLNTNDYWVHPGVLWEEVLKKTDQVSLLEIEENPTEDDVTKTLDYAQYYDTVIMTYYVKRARNAKMIDLIDKVRGMGKKVIVIANSPLPHNTPKEWPTVVSPCGVMPPQLKMAVELMYGDFKELEPKK